MTDARVPALYLGHGAPPLLDAPVWPGELAAWSARLSRPRAVLMVSAHWEDAPVALSSLTPGTRLVYDFSGFPQHYYRLQYPAPPAGWLADLVARRLAAGAAVDEHEPSYLRRPAAVPSPTALTPHSALGCGRSGR